MSSKTTTADKDVACRRWLFVDFDPVRPAGISSSDAEHEAALDRARRCREWLSRQSVPSVLADSGNGAHLLLPIDLPNTPDSTDFLKRILVTLSAQFDDAQVQIDTSTVNASRIIKLYGTLACKGDNVPERPHRQAAILEVPEMWEPVDRCVLEQLAQPDAPPKQRSTIPPKKSGTTSKPDNRAVIEDIKARFDMVAYAEGKLGVSAVQSGNEYRLPGNQGFLINVEKGCWYRHGGQAGGNALDLVGFFQYENGWNRQDKIMFRTVLREAAEVTGVPLPAPAKTKRRRKAAVAVDSTADGTASSSSAFARDLLDLAHLWKERHLDALAWDARLGAWRCWTGTHWQPERDPGVLDLFASDIIRSTGGAVNSIQKLDSVIRLARALCKREFSPSRQCINFQNGTLDLHSMVGHLHTPDDDLTECLPYDYAPKATYPTIEHFLSSVIPDAHGQRAYMAHLGLALVGDQTFHKALVLLGPPRSGKTTLLKLAQRILAGTPGQFPTAVLFSPESRGANSRAAWIDQSPRLVCLDEFPEEALRDEGEELFKRMTAHGGVSMWLKYRDERAENRWTTKLLFATNNRMRYRDPSGALTRRLLIVECPRSLPDARLDSTLLDRFTPELGAFAAACIKVALDVQQARTYPESEAMRNLLQDIERNGDAIKLWLSENCVFEPHGFVPTHTLYQNFRWWCEENGLHPVSRPKLRDMMCGAREGVHSTRQRVLDPADGQKKMLWGIVGVRLRTPADDHNDPP